MSEENDCDEPLYRAGIVLEACKQNYLAGLSRQSCYSEPGRQRAIQSLIDKARKNELPFRCNPLADGRKSFRRVEMKRRRRQS
jgi:hypothetical protein